jgi:hypothetical protein
MADDTAEIEQLRESIAKSVSEYWAATGKAMLLSALGAQLRREFPNAPPLMPQGLRAFLSSWPMVHVVTHPETPEKIGAVPLSVDIPEDHRELFGERLPWAPATTRQFPLATQHPRYAPEFWKAFHTPIDVKRFIVIPTAENPNLRIVEGAEGPDEVGCYEVLPSDVSLLPTQAPLYEKVQATSQRIKDWLARNGLSAKLFTSPLPEASRRQINLPAFEERRSVAAALAKLEPSDQARILVPLDIVAKLIIGNR